MLYDQVLERIKKNKENRSNNKFNGVPFPFERMREHYPSFNKGDSIGILAGTGTGKSTLLRYLFIYYLYDFHKKNNYPIRILYLPLEDSKEKVYDYFLCHYLYEVHDLHISPNELNSRGNYRELPDIVVEKLEEAREYFSDFESVTNIVDGYSSPKEIYDVMREYALKTGKVKSYKVDIGGREEKQYLYESDIHTFLLIDNLSNVDKEDGHQSERHAVVELAKTYIREKLCNFFKFTVIQLMQNDFQTERQQFSTNGKSIAGKVEPSLASIGDAKTVSRSMHIIFTLFDPSRYEFIRYPQVSEAYADKAYNIDLLGDKFRSLRIIKNNDGATGVRVGLLMNPISGEFEELPKPDSDEMKRIYIKLKQKKNGANRAVDEALSF